VGMKYDIVASAAESNDETLKLWKKSGDEWENF